VRAARRRRPRAPGQEEEQRPPVRDRQESTEAGRAPAASTDETPLAAAGPALGLAAHAGPGPTTSGRGSPHHEEVHGGTSVRLQGLTEADYDGGSYRTTGERLRPAESCESCGSPDCVRVTGTLIATYHVTTTVTLPSAGDYPDLTACQRRRVQDAIANVLAPHEQEHVRAFRQYNGTTRRRFDLTLCRGDFDARIQEMFEAEEAQRRAQAQAASDALDPFHFDVSLDCEDEATTTGTGASVAAEGER
jgi:hypothetical protein